MAEKLLSVIIPACNVAGYIIECVDSLLAEIPAPNELIIINDGSTDDTLLRLDEHYAREKRVRVVTIPNGGAGAARDYGVTLANGQFIFFCDPDDVVCKGLFTELSCTIQQWPELELFCFNSLCFADGNPQQTWRKVKHHQFGLLPALDVFQGLLRNGTYTSATWNYVIKKEVIDRYNLKYVQRVHEDHLFSLGAFMRCGTAFVSRHVYYRQRVRSGSLTNSSKDESYFFQRYQAFIAAWEKLVRLTDCAELRYLYLIHSFRLMIHLFVVSSEPMPDYLRHAILYFGKNLKPARIVDWLLLRKPEIYFNLLRIKQRTPTIKRFLLKVRG
ncbi:glycosyltransferase family 2 protein [Erwinia amylovora]|uniref:Uncharacterized glycosyltransferase yibD n=4 Tax=Erwinia amylovora TaxID=552 RepID=A0A831A5I5_ERWAM|nr:glycosyltransferase family 2 protein [Erwinia amylovora]CDK15556.1 putative glycosyltransferase yibD [Erwinia amylovora LA635]CDK18923.1 putative glycosyltransferase yibD [Erwinia amylovora LA636]CDK22293.1 putative glycosyltransferase yibD [Erwinia amylovora LA637]ATZ11851.1 glycosyl transferase [Erwinia amylovora]EKV54815.1 putative glycosyltransferase yibD [Erwinia amylovora ACW56400]